MPRTSHKTRRSDPPATPDVTVASIAQLTKLPAEILRLHLSSRHPVSTGTKAAMAHRLYDSIHPCLQHRPPLCARYLCVAYLCAGVLLYVLDIWSSVARHLCVAVLFYVLNICKLLYCSMCSICVCCCVALCARYLYIARYFCVAQYLLLNICVLLDISVLLNICCSIFVCCCVALCVRYLCFAQSARSIFVLLNVLNICVLLNMLNNYSLCCMLLCSSAVLCAHNLSL